MSLNIRKGLLKKKKQILNFMYAKEVGIAFLSEVETKQLTLENLVCDGYKTVTQKTESKYHKARIVALVANSVPFNVRLDLMSPQVPTIWLEITRYNMKNVLICGIYRQWKGDQLKQLSIVSDQIRRASAEGLPLLVAGDTNLDSSRWSSPKFRLKSMSDKWKSTIASAGLMMEDMGITWESDYRLKNGKYKKSALDHFYHSTAEVNINEQDDAMMKEQADDEAIAPISDEAGQEWIKRSESDACGAIFDNFQKFSPTISDHYTIMCSVKVAQQPKPEQGYILRRSWANWDTPMFLLDLVNQDWGEVIDPQKNAHQQASAFMNIFGSCVNRHAPLRRSKVRPNPRKGLSVRTKFLMRKRNRLRLQKNRCKNVEKKALLQKKYSDARNAVISRIRKEDKQATIDSVKKSGNTSEYWKAAKAAVSSLIKSMLELKEGGVKIKDEKILAEIFNKFFKKKIEDIEKSIPVHDIDPTCKLKEKLKGRNLSFHLPTVTETEVKKAIHSLKPKTSSGLDFISPKIVKLAVDVIATPLTYVINTSLLSGEFPSTWKEAKVIPIFKNKGSRMDKQFYRPVSNLKSVSKVIEVIVNKKVLEYFESNHLFPDSQHGFRSSRSTFSAVASMHEQWIKNREGKKHQAMAFLDLSAAFDTLSKDIFCKKLEVYGFDKTSVKWFNSYLSERSQRVMIGSSISAPVSLNVGCPQGAILSPTCFLILISDIEEWANHAQLCGYADDTSATVTDEDISVLQEKCEESVNGLLTFMAVNRLSANDDKTHVLVSKSGKNNHALTFNIGQASVKESSDEKLLGIWVSNDLQWSKHLEKLQNKLLVSLYTLRQMEQVVPRSLLKNVAEGIFMSSLRYGLSIFCPVKIKPTDPTPTCINGIKIVFNDMLRLLCGSRRMNKLSVKKMLDSLGWLSINQLSAEIRLTEVWKSINTEYCLSDMFQLTKSNTRAVKKSRVTTPKVILSRLRQNSFLYPSCKLWNCAPVQVTQAKSLAEAKREIRAFVKTLPL